MKLLLALGVIVVVVLGLLTAARNARRRRRRAVRESSYLVEAVHPEKRTLEHSVLPPGQ